jgi:nicotinate-nucleotide pyrophosphorylase (carboxylating)
MNPFEHPAVRRLVAAALEEDVGRGDVTTEATIDRDAEAVGTVVSREPVVFAGGELVRVILAEARVSATSVARVEDGMAGHGGRLGRRALRDPRAGA